MKNKVRIGIFGIGHNHAAAAIKTLRALEGVEIVGLCEDDKAMLERRIKENPGVYGDIRVMTKAELFDSRLDAAMCEPSVPYLVPTALECAKHGLHIHMDKPAGVDLEEYAKLLGELSSRRLVFQTGYMYRYNAGIRYVIDSVKDGKLGRIYNITAAMSTKHPEWFKKQLISYGVKAPAMYIFGCHLFDLCLLIKGKPESVTTFHARSQDGGVDFDDTSLSVLKYPDGVATVKVSSVEINGWGMREFTVYGERGTISVSPIENKMLVKETLIDEQEPWKDRFRYVDIEETGRYDVMMREFIDMIRGDIPYDVDFSHEYELQKLTLSASGVEV